MMVVTPVERAGQLVTVEAHAVMVLTIVDLTVDVVKDTEYVPETAEEVEELDELTVAFG
jgi:hypothetical protein